MPVGGAALAGGRAPAREPDEVRSRSSVGVGVGVGVGLGAGVDTGGGVLLGLPPPPPQPASKIVRATSGNPAVRHRSFIKYSPLPLAQKAAVTPISAPNL